MTKEERKKWIDNASYEDLLRRWRFASAGSPWFQGEIGIYFEKIMMKKKKEVGHAAAVRASKTIGWEE